MTELETKLFNIAKIINANQETLVQELNDTAERIETLNNTIETLLKNQVYLNDSLKAFKKQLSEFESRISHLSNT